MRALPRHVIGRKIVAVDLNHTPLLVLDNGARLVCGDELSYKPRGSLMEWVADDGGRSDHFRGEARDCVTRAISIALDLPYLQTYEELNALAKAMERRGRPKPSAARTGVRRPVYERYLEQHGWRWTPTMQIGAGCTVHLCAGELPAGRLIVALSRHLTVVINHVIHDNHDPSRGGRRCVYGYYAKERC